MPSIYLVRHGQASFGAENYDNLSELGHEQAKVLGTNLLKREIEIGKTLSGEMLRHKQTAEGCASGLNTSFDLTIDAGFNEFDHEQVIAIIEPDFKNKTKMAERLSKSGSSPRSVFEDIFQRAMTRWLSGEHDSDYTESWIEFQNRVVNSFKNAIDQHKNANNIFVFTSGGPIAVICQHLLNIPNSDVMKLNASIVNASVTKIRFNEDNASLVYFNNFTHFESKATKHLMSFR